MGHNAATTAFKITNPAVILVQYSVMEASLHLLETWSTQKHDRRTDALATTDNQQWTISIRNNGDLQEALYANTRALLTLCASC
jgi:hypothetical protein